MVDSAGAFAEVRETCPAAGFLVSDEAGYITGTVLAGIVACRCRRVPGTHDRRRLVPYERRRDRVSSGAETSAPKPVLEHLV